MLDTQPAGFLAVPAAGAGRGVLVLHAWWGLNDTMRTLCRRLAENGFVAFAPDLFQGQVADSIAGAETLVHTVDGEQAAATVAEAARFLTQRATEPGRGLAVIGFSFGAPFALDLSVADPQHVRQVVLFYGTGGADFSQSQAEYLGHFAENDPYEPPSGVDELEQDLRRAGRPVTFYHYLGTGHWFSEPDRPDAFNRAAADLAWERTLVFLS